MTAPGIPNEYSLSTTCFGSRLTNIQDQIFAAVGMGFRRIELGLAETPPSMDGLEDSKRETGVTMPSLIAGCRDPLNGSMVVERLGSLQTEERERALNSVRRHVRLAHSWGCQTVVVRGSQVDNAALQREASALILKVEEEGQSPELREEVEAFVRRVQNGGQEQVQHLCRSLHTLGSEFPGTVFALEPGREIGDLLGFEAMGWVLDDLEHVQYWHDLGRIHLRENMGLPPQGQWLETYGARMAGIHLQDAGEEEAEMPIGAGEVDFKLVSEYVPEGAQKVVEIGPRHGRAEILASLKYLLALGL